MTNQEQEQFKVLLTKYCQEELDQWGSIKVETVGYGDVFILISRKNHFDMWIEGDTVFKAKEILT